MLTPGTYLRQEPLYHPDIQFLHGKNHRHDFSKRRRINPFIAFFSARIFPVERSVSTAALLESFWRFRVSERTPCSVSLFFCSKFPTAQVPMPAAHTSLSETG